VRKITFPILFCTVLIVAIACSNGSEQTETTNASDETEENNVDHGSRLNEIIEEGVIRVGTTGDYKPFTYLNPDTGEFEGSDIDAAKLLAEELGVKVEFVETSWPTLMDDLLAGKFDIGMGGITRTLEREKTAHMSKPYLDFGKAAIIRKEDKDTFTSVEAMNQPDVKVGVNPGGTNEEYVREHLTETDVTVVDNNLEIPGMVADGEFDLMISESLEAILFEKVDDRLYAAFIDDTLTKSQMGYIMPQGETELHNWVNLWIDEMMLNETFEELIDKWMQ